MTIKASDKVSTVGGLVETISQGNEVAASTAGQLFLIPCPSGKKIVITGLMPQTTTQTNIEIKFGSRILYSGTISDSLATNALTITKAGNVTSSEFAAVGVLNELGGDYDEDLTITKTSSTTTAIIHLSYVITN